MWGRLDEVIQTSQGLDLHWVEVPNLGEVHDITKLSALVTKDASRDVLTVNPAQIPKLAVQ